METERPPTRHPTWTVFDTFNAPERRKLPIPRWSVFDGFERTHRHVSWRGLEAFIEKGRTYAAARCREFPDVRSQWERLLVDFDGDPSTSDWLAFRPLRIDREEGWSDWLAHFIATSTTGAFCQQLLGRAGLVGTSSYVGPDVVREDVADDRRADLVIRWRDGSRTHVEVKVGDRRFAKTAETASKLELQHPGAWTHYILMPAGDVDRWNALDHPATPTVRVATWDDVAVALRRSLRCQEENRQWRSWALGFCGLVEQLLLGHPRARDAENSLSNVKRRMHQLSIMKKGLEDV